MQKGHFAGENQVFGEHRMEAYSTKTNQDSVCGALLHMQR